MRYSERYGIPKEYGVSFWKVGFYHTIPYSRPWSASPRAPNNAIVVHGGLLTLILVARKLSLAHCDAVSGVFILLGALNSILRFNLKRVKYFLKMQLLLFSSIVFAVTQAREFTPITQQFYAGLGSNTWWTDFS